MGLIAKILSFTRVVRNGVEVTDLKANPGGGPTVTAEHFSAPGDDSYPLSTDYAVLTGTPGSGRFSAVGYLDPLNTPKAQEGEKRIYARDASSGDVVVEIWLQNDGSVQASNSNGSLELRADGSIQGTNGSGTFELKAGGNFTVNGVTIDTSGNITSPATVTADTIAGDSSVVAAGKELAGHDHDITSGSSAPGPTGPNN